MVSQLRNLWIIVVVLLFIGIFIVTKYIPSTKIMMSYWGNYAEESINYPIPGSLNEKGERRNNADMQSKLNFLNVFAYAFLHVNQNGEIHFKASQVDLSLADNEFCTANKNICTDDEGKYNPQLGNFTAFTRLQNDTKTLKKLISIGGGSDQTSLDYAISHPTAFINSVATIIAYYHLDGVDLDFEPHSFTPQQAVGYTTLMVELRKKLGEKALIIITISPYQTIHRNHWEVMAKHANFISDMCYSFHTPLIPPYYTGYNSNLYPDANQPVINNYHRISCDQSIKNLISSGVPAKKIILGYPSYALAYGGVPNNNNGLFQPSDPNKIPVLDGKMKEQGAVPYQAIAKLLASGFREYASYYNGHMSGVWAYNPATQQFLAYDNPQLVQEKARYVNENNLAGLMTWLISYDEPVTSEHSLLKATKR